MSEQTAAERVRKELARLAAGDGEDMQQLLLRYACERFLYRLSESSVADNFILKGALLFTYWHAEAHRTTRDIDLLGRGESDDQHIEAIFRQVLQKPIPEDGLVFDLATLTVMPIREDKVYGGQRLRVRCSLGKARMALQVDIGFGDRVRAESRQLETLLDLPRPRLHIYPRAAVVAEKTEAMVQLGVFTSRMKDFYDIAALARGFAFDGAEVAQVLGETFQRRGTEIPNGGLSRLFSALRAAPEKNAQWVGFLRKANARYQWTLEEVLSLVQAFMDEPLAAALRGEPFDRAWQPGGPWRAGTQEDGGQ